MSVYELCEADVPGASLHGRDPGMLTVPELKRWLACRGASRRGRKADLVLRVSEYIAAGLDKEIVDPDGGANVERKRAQLEKAGLDQSTGHPNLQCDVPAPESGWVKSLRKLPTVTFASIYNHFMERSLKVVVGLAAARQHVSRSASGEESDVEVYSSFRGIDKGYKFFKDGHVQAIEFHDLDGNPERCYVRSKVLPSMRKTEPYRARICLFRDGMVEVAYCVCTAGLAGCCNHIAGLLYALEEFVRLGLREEPESPTSRLCKWNKPRSKKVAPCKVADIRLSQSQFLKEKRSRGPKAVYNPIPPNKRLVDPAEITQLRTDMTGAHEHALSTDASGKVRQYGPCTYLTALETSSESSSSSSSSSESDDDSTGASSETNADVHRTPHSAGVATPGTPPTFSIEDFYRHGYPESVAAIQPLSAQWHVERRKRVTATLCKKVACRRSDDFTRILCEKLSGSFTGTRATRYGQANEENALQCYLQMSPAFTIQPSSMVVHSKSPWLAATPDAFATDPMSGTGVVEVKCPYICRDKSLWDAAASSSCLSVLGESLSLKKSHTYYYQVQHQMFVTDCDWADFVVWTPRETHVQRIVRDRAFFEGVLPKLHDFFFGHLLPALYSEHL